MLWKKQCDWFGQISGQRKNGASMLGQWWTHAFMAVRNVIMRNRQQLLSSSPSSMGIGETGALEVWNIIARWVAFAEEFPCINCESWPRFFLQKWFWDVSRRCLHWVVGFGAAQQLNGFSLRSLCTEYICTGLWSCTSWKEPKNSHCKKSVRVYSRTSVPLFRHVLETTMSSPLQLGLLCCQIFPYARLSEWGRESLLTGWQIHLLPWILQSAWTQQSQLRILVIGFLLSNGTFWCKSGVLFLFNHIATYANRTYLWTYHLISFFSSDSSLDSYYISRFILKL